MSNIFDQYAAAEERLFCFSCHDEITKLPLKQRETIEVSYRAFASSIKKIVFHSDCFFNEAGDSYRNALDPKPKVPNTMKEQFKDVVTDANEELLKQFQYEKELMKRQMRREIEEQKMFEKIQRMQKLADLHTYDNENFYNEWYDKEGEKPK
jgi:hypothetical protein